jgi:hypothetical protein
MATTRSTAGLGFDFEDQIGAWMLLKMLSGEPLPDMERARDSIADANGWVGLEDR